MGLPTQELDKDESVDQEENDDNLHAGRGKPVAYLRVNQWSVTSEKMPRAELPMVYPIFDGSNHIGRSTGSCICFPFSVISGRHACIDVKQTLHTVRDCVSTNETKRNGVSLDSEVRYEILDGTELSFADVECTYYIGRLPNEDEMRALKLSTGIKEKPAATTYTDFDQLSIASTTAVTTVFRNFLSDEDSEKLLDDSDFASGNVETTEDGSAVKASPSATRRKNDNLAPVLSILAEESQFIIDGRRPASSALGNESKNIPQVVRETEQFLVDDNFGRENQKIAVEDRGQQALADNFGASRSKSVGSERHSEEPSENGAGPDDSTKANMRMERTKSTSASDRSSLEEAVRATDETRTPYRGSAAQAETLPYLGGLPVALDSFSVNHRLNSILVTPASSASGTTVSGESVAASTTVGRKLTSVWSAPNSGRTSARSAKKRSLLDDAADHWLFKSEPDMRQRTARNSASRRRKTTYEKAKTSFEELTNKYSKAVLAAKRISREKKAMEEKPKDILKLASEAAEKIKDPFEFGSSQALPEEIIESAPPDIAQKPSANSGPSEKRQQKARKSVKPIADYAVARVSPNPSSVGRLKRKRVNDEEKFDEAADRSLQQRHAPSKEKQAEPDALEEVKTRNRRYEGAPNTSYLERSDCEPTAKKSKVDERGVHGISLDENSADAVDAIATEAADHPEVQDEPPNTTTVKAEVSDELQKPKRKARAPAKKKPSAKPNHKSEKAIRDSEELSDIILVPKPKAKKSEKAEKETRKPAAAKSKKNSGKDLIDSDARQVVKVCFTQIVGSSSGKLQELIQAVKALKGEITDSGVDCTHLVVPKFARSAKFMCAVARGVPIVVPEWIEESKRVGHFIDTDTFLIEDKAEEKRIGFNLRSCLSDARECLTTANKRLFDGYTLYSTANVGPKREEMKAIVTSAGGRFLDSLPKSAPRDTIFIAISCEADRESTDVKRLQSMKVPIVSMEFVLTGLLKREINIEKYAVFEIPEATKRPKGGLTSVSEASSTRSGKKTKAKGKK